MNKFSKNNKLMSIFLTLSCATVLICLFLLEWDYLTNMNYSLHEFFALPINIGFFLIPIETLIWFVSWVRYRLNRNNELNDNTFFNIMSSLSLIICVIVITFYMNNVTSEGYSKEFEKYSINKECYIKLNDKFIEISEEQYNQFEVGELYHFVYKYNKLIPEVYKIAVLEKKNPN